MADQAEAAQQAARSPLDQAAADGSITQARTRAVDPVPIVAEMAAGSATLEPVLETNETDMGVSVDPDVQTVDGVSGGSADGGTAPAAGARRRLSPRPVPVSRRRRAPAATDEERTPAEEMDDVGTQDDKAEAAAEAATAGTTPGTDTGAAASSASGTTATKTVRPKTAAEIVAEQRARESAAASSASSASAGDAPAAAAGSEDAAAGTPAAAGGDAEKPAATGATAAAKPPAKPSGASGNKPPVSKNASAGSGKGKQALTSVGSGVRKLRNLIASLIWLIAVLAAAVLALGALFTALDQTNQSNEIVRWILERGHDLVGPFKDLFRLQTAKNSLLVNWGIAALVYLIAGKIVEKIIRP
ncbi:hypothetical protein ACQHIV_01645 [Kribbella sp. GL6]|uniref:hypothetical protein n=1 Tax=Kribbella sp. GL6 TaxID=3419765 RepID=UPI003D064888